MPTPPACTGWYTGYSHRVSCSCTATGPRSADTRSQASGAEHAPGPLSAPAQCCVHAGMQHPHPSCPNTAAAGRRLPSIDSPHAWAPRARPRERRPRVCPRRAHRQVDD
eukprot:scaffold45696_cov27-Tisochrysis_lutea.AAC.1